MLIVEDALLPDGWASRVALTIEDGVIARVEKNWRGPEIARKAIALPGLPNVHSHVFQRALAGLAERRGPGQDSFWTWRETMYRFLDCMDPDEFEAIATFAMMEMLEGGFTALAEFHYVHHDETGHPYGDLAEMAGRVAAAASRTGIGLTLLPALYTHGGFGAKAPDAGQRRFVNDLDRFLRLLESAEAKVRGLPDAIVGAAPHSLRAVSGDQLSRLVALRTAGPIHIHVAEQVPEVNACLAWSGRRPVDWLLDNAPVDERWCLIHATHLSDGETARLAVSGAVVGLCPVTEANLGDGIFRAKEFVARKGRFGVGTDSNIETTAAGELKQLEYSQRLQWRERNLLADAGGSTGRALYAGALAGGARAAGRRIGAIAPGHRADLVFLNRDHPDLHAAASDAWIDAYVFVAGRSAVDAVMVGGKVVVEAGRHVARDEIVGAYKKTMLGLLRRATDRTGI